MRGDVHPLKNLRGTRGREQQGRWYAVVLLSDLLPLSTWLVAPTSTQARPTSFRPQIEVDDTPTLVLVEQTAAVEPQWLGDPIGHLTHSEMSFVEAGLRTVLGLDGP